MDVIAVQVLRSDPGRLIGFGVGAQLAANGLGVEADVDRDADLAVVIGDAVPRVAEDADQPGQLDLQPGLLAAFPDGARSERLLFLQRAGRDGPPP